MTKAELIRRAEKEGLSESQTIKLLEKHGFVKPDYSKNKAGFTKAEEEFIGDDSSSSKKERTIKKMNERRKQLEEMRMETVKGIMAKEAEAKEKNKIKDTQLMQQIAKKKLGMKYGGMANGKKHNYVCGGSVHSKI